MIIDYKGLELFGKLLFEKAVIKPPYSLPSQMANSACFIYVLEGVCDTIGETATNTIKKEEAVFIEVRQLYPQNK